MLLRAVVDMWTGAEAVLWTLDVREEIGAFPVAVVEVDVATEAVEVAPIGAADVDVAAPTAPADAEAVGFDLC